MDIPFSKYSGCGNDFILIDNRNLAFPLSPSMINRLCHRNDGIGADGLIFLETSENADHKMRIFNADGSEAEMCGNGLRCLAKFIKELARISHKISDEGGRDVAPDSLTMGREHCPSDKARPVEGEDGVTDCSDSPRVCEKYGLGFAKEKFSIETLRGILNINIHSEKVIAEMPVIQNIHWNIDLGKFKIHSLDTGVPHAVLFVEGINSFEVENLGKWVRSHPYFQPNGTNANFAEMQSNGTIRLRTYERGLEKETNACGTGAVAAALAAAYHYDRQSPITILPVSGGGIVVFFERKDDTFQNVQMEGPATLIFQGRIEIDHL